MNNYPTVPTAIPVALKSIISFISRTKHPFSLSQEVKTITKLMQVIDPNNTGFLFIVSRADQNAATALLTEAVILTITYCRQVIDGDLFVLQFHPYVDVFIQNARKIERHKYDGSYPCFANMQDSISQFVHDVKQAMMSPDFKKLLYKARRRSANNTIGLRRYIDYLFTCYARLLVLRVDLEYQSGNVIHNEQDMLIKYQEASNDRKHFFNNMASNKLFKHLIGTAWTLEYGVETGFHYHMLLIYDGSKVREDETLAFWVGKYWSCNITEGRGRDFNCNAKKDEYDELGIGMINYYDKVLREGLNHATDYLTKINHLAHNMIPDGCKSFGRGEELAIDQPKMGRRRSHS